MNVWHIPAKVNVKCENYKQFDNFENFGVHFEIFENCKKQLHFDNVNL